MLNNNNNNNNNLTKLRVIAVLVGTIFCSIVLLIVVAINRQNQKTIDLDKLRDAKVVECHLLYKSFKGQQGSYHTSAAFDCPVPYGIIISTDEEIVREAEKTVSLKVYDTGNSLFGIYSRRKVKYEILDLVVR